MSRIYLQRQFFVLPTLFLLSVITFMSCEKNPDDIPNSHPLTTATEYINYTINGTPYSYAVPADNFTCILDNQIMFFVFGFRPSPQDTVKLLVTGGNNPTMTLQGFSVPQFSNDPASTGPSSRTVNVSEYPNAVGEYLSGNFSYVFTGQPPANNNYTVTCSFRVRRDQ